MNQNGVYWMLPMCKAYARQSGDMERLVWILPLISYCGGFPATKDKVGVNHQCPLLGALILMIYFASSSCVYISYILTPCTNIYVKFNPLFSLHNKSASTKCPWDSSWIFGGENESYIVLRLDFYNNFLFLLSSWFCSLLSVEAKQNVLPLSCM